MTFMAAAVELSSSKRQRSELQYMEMCLSNEQQYVADHLNDLSVKSAHDENYDMDTDPAAIQLQELDEELEAEIASQLMYLYEEISGLESQVKTEAKKGLWMMN